MKNLEAEKSLLSCLFLAQKNVATETVNKILGLSPTIFKSLLNQTIFNEFKELVAKGYEPDAIGIEHFVKDQECLVLSDGSILNYIVELIDSEPTYRSAPLHIDILVDIERRDSYKASLMLASQEYVDKIKYYLDILADVNQTIPEEELKRFLELTGAKALEGDK